MNILKYKAFHSFNMNRECNRCKKKKYGYSDGIHEVWICYICGHFDGQAKGDELFITSIMQEPALVLAMIEQKMLKPIKSDR